MISYPLELTPDDDTLLVTCPDLPGVVTYGETEAEALQWASFRALGIEPDIVARAA